MEPQHGPVGLRDGARPDVVSAFSVDVEDYFHVEAFRGVVDPADGPRWSSGWSRTPAGCSTCWMRTACARRSSCWAGWASAAGLVRDIHAAGHEVGIHGYDHRPITMMTEPSSVRHPARQGHRRGPHGEPVLGYRAPTYSVVRDTMWALDVMAEGLAYDSSIFPIVHDRYGIPDAPGTRGSRSEASAAGRVPDLDRAAVRPQPAVHRRGYLRLLPMPYVRWGARRVTGRERRPLMLYVHPWEIDPDQPVLDVGRVTRLRHYRGLGRVEHRLDELLGTCRFDTVRSVLGL